MICQRDVDGDNKKVQVFKHPTKTKMEVDKT